jgi:hypothetical protein
MFDKFVDMSDEELLRRLPKDGKKTYGQALLVQIVCLLLLVSDRIGYTTRP